MVWKTVVAALPSSGPIPRTPKAASCRYQRICNARLKAAYRVSQREVDLHYAGPGLQVPWVAQAEEEATMAMEEAATTEVAITPAPSPHATTPATIGGGGDAPLEPSARAAESEARRTIKTSSREAERGAGSSRGC